jgi:O-antigen/teichoic acid export membrane protein
MIFQATGELMIPAMILTIATVVEIVLAAWSVPAFGAVGAAWALVGASGGAIVALLIAFFRRYWLRFSVSGVVRYLLCVGLFILLLTVAPATTKYMIVGKMALAYGLYLLSLVLTRVLDAGDIRTLATGVHFPDRLLHLMLRALGYRTREGSGERR